MEQGIVHTGLHGSPTRIQVLDWLRANGVDPDLVTAGDPVEVIMDGPKSQRIHYVRLFKHDNGRIAISPSGYAIRESVSVPLVVEL